MAMRILACSSSSEAIFLNLGTSGRLLLVGLEDQEAVLQVRAYQQQLRHNEGLPYNSCNTTNLHNTAYYKLFS